MNNNNQLEEIYQEYEENKSTNVVYTAKDLWTEKEIVQLIGKVAVEMQKRRYEHLKGKKGRKEQEPVKLSTAYTAVALLLQRGASFRRANDSLHIVVNNFELTLGLLKIARSKSEVKKSLRRLAKTICTRIYGVAKDASAQGNLAQKILRKYPEWTGKEEVYWMSDFQLDNPDCPENIRKIIAEVLADSKQRRVSKKVK